ncbi:polysaccharide pyruvyl transferase family protein [Bradyrhizobium prioriisuperbiae]|uniref:polysaccharide pyruvyl transferase family protein n=1 Tax=Bradyrhizobium prioriisuperbiae TaxID=2854389 RepID=UPI0028E5B013|nr:polysaccharide pyruvyl transferase family protein [Bradyrhizobium prioritasuperba]
MFRNALVVGVRQVNQHGEAATVEQTMLSLGQNTGNMMFTQSLLRVLHGAKWGSFALSPEEIEGHDAIVLAAANWVNHFDDFGWLADRLEKTKLPVFLIGVGAQASNSEEIPNVTEGTLRLLRLVQDRSVSISARGTFSCEVLERYGITNVHPTGCPSLMLIGRDGPSPSLLNDVGFDACCMHATRHGFSKTDSFQTFLYRQAISRNIDLVLQSEIADIHYIMQHRTGEALPEKAEQAVMAVYGAAAGQVEDFLIRHGRVFTLYQDWIDYMKQRSFCFGTRIHGTVAALIAGTPAALIVHDSRTVEMADIMGVPIVRWQDIPCDRDIDIAALYSRAQLQEFVKKFSGYYDGFLDYMARNALLVAGNYREADRRILYAS